MSKINVKEQFWTALGNLSLIAFLSFITIGFSYGQCPTTPGCNSNVQISLDNSCEAVLLPSLMIEGSPGTCAYQVRVMDANDKVLQSSQIVGGEIIHPTIDASFIGGRYRGEVFFIDENGVEVSCWGYFTVEDKLAPELDCISDFTVSCKDNLSDLMTRTSSLELCASGPGLVDGNETTFSLEVSDGDIAPYEVITAISTIVPLTGSGTGIFFTIDGVKVPMMQTPIATGSGTASTVVLSALIGSQIIDVDGVTLTFPNDNVPMLTDPIDLCFEIESASFALASTSDNCTNAEIVITRDELDENECGPEGITAERIIEYVAVDGSGLTSNACQFLISFEKAELTDVVFPANIEIECDAMNMPGTNVTGVPTLDGCDLSLVDNLCKFNISFEDDTTATCGSNFSIFRTWNIIDWCAAENRQSFQTINISDTTNPLISCPTGPIVFETNGDCTAVPTFNPFATGSATGLTRAIDCSSLSSGIYYETASGFVMFNGNSLPAGGYTFRYVITDDCDNESNCDFEIDIVDSTSPIAVCDQFTAVSLDEDGWGRLFGPSLDDGSFDQCGGPVTLDVRRETTPCADLPDYDRDDTMFGPFVQFCCAETGDTIPTILRVSDAGGMTSTCVVNVVVQDKHGNFSLGCPTPNLTATCSGSIAGLQNLFTAPAPINSCGPVPTFIITDDVDGLQDCGVGSISRTYTAVFGQDTTNTSCVQRITVTPGSALTNSDFIAPVEEVESPTVNCGNFMEDTGDGPRLRGAASICNDVGFTFDDEPFFGVEGYCVKIIRTWTAIDFCNHNAATGEGVFGPWTQTIKVSDSTGPELSNCPEDVTVAVGGMNCEAFVEIPIPSATDLCFGEALPESAFEWQLSGSASASGDGNTASQILGVGTYTLTWSATGDCGSTSSCAPAMTIRVEDTGDPIVYCRTNVTTVISTSAPGQLPSVDVWANDFDLNSTDDCGGNLTISFSPTDASDTQRVFGCDQLGFQTLQVYFTDSSGNQDFCTTSINIQANGAICDTIGQRPIVRIEGDVFTEMDQMVEDVEVGLQNMTNGTMNLKATDTNGHLNKLLVG